MLLYARVRSRVFVIYTSYSNTFLLYPIYAMLHPAAIGTSRWMPLRVKPDAVAQMSGSNASGTKASNPLRKCHDSCKGCIPNIEARKGSDRVFKARRLGAMACAAR